MITETILSFVFMVIRDFMMLIPETFFKLPDWGIQAFKMIRIGLGIFPNDVWLVCIMNGLFWITIQFTWSMIEWVYKKIPGVD